MNSLLKISNSFNYAQKDNSNEKFSKTKEHLVLVINNIASTIFYLYTGSPIDINELSFFKKMFKPLTAPNLAFDVILNLEGVYLRDEAKLGSLASSRKLTDSKFKITSKARFGAVRGLKNSFLKRYK